MSQLEKTYSIKGMSCGGCIKSLTRVLSAVPGIEPVRIEVGTAVVRLEDGVATSETVHSAVARAGFTITGEVETTP